MVTENSSLEYCYKHRRFYHKDAGCSPCLLDEIRNREEAGKPPRTPVCPDCGQNSLAGDRNRYECINSSCPRKAACPKHEIVRVVPDTNLVLTCPHCGESSLVWVRPFVHYQCIKCKSTFDNHKFAHYECKKCMTTYAKEKIGEWQNNL